MFHVEASATLPFAPAAVFAAVGSVEAALRWQVGVLGVRRARHRPDGATLLVSYFALGERHLLATRVTAYDPPRCFAYRAAGDRFALEVLLDAAPALGGTRVRYRLRLSTHAEPGDEPAAARAAALRRLVGRRAPRDLARLEVHVARRLGRSRPARPADPLDEVPPPSGDPLIAAVFAAAAPRELLAPPHEDAPNAAPAVPAVPPDGPAPSVAPFPPLAS